MSDLEQYPPRKPNFKLIVVLFCVTILVILGAAIAVMHFRNESGSAHSLRRTGGRVTTLSC